MAFMQKPTFVCLHGAWHNPSCWDKIRGLLAAHDYPCVCPRLPSTGANPPLRDFQEDVDIVRSTVTDLVEENKTVLVVMHSYSGIPGGQALEGLDKKSRSERGLAGGVTRLIYIMSFIVPEGFQHSTRGTRENMVPVMKTDFEAGTVIIQPEDAKGLFYQDMEDGIVSELAKDLQPQSLGVFWSTTSYAAWKHVPTTYVICENDTPSTVVAAEYLLSSAQATEGNKIDSVVKRKVGHSPFLSQPEWTVGMLREAAGEHLGQI